MLLPSFGVDGHSNAESLPSRNEEQTDLPSPRPLSHANYLDLRRAPDQPFRQAQLTNYSLPIIMDVGGKPHRIPSPASPIQLCDANSPPAGCCPGLSTVPAIAPKGIFTPQHMILLHHADRVPNFTAPNRSAVDIAVRHIIGSPYLMDEVLAFTAFHMAYLYPGSAAYLRQLAAELQNRALTSFSRLTQMVPIDDKATAVPRFLFSAILGRHVLADTLTHYHSDFHVFIDRFIDCINLNRGIKAVTPPASDFLNDTEIQPFLSVVLEAQKKIVSSGVECGPLKRLMENSDLNDVSIKACLQAIEILQFSFDLCHELSEEDYPQAASVFSVRIEADFVEVLRRHRPEALVILAYYGVLLFRCRSFWAFGDAGTIMIRAIAGQLGSYWQEALAWPLHVLDTERTPELSTSEPNYDILTMPSHSST